MPDQSVPLKSTKMAAFMHLCLIITWSFNLGARRQMPEPPPGSGTGSEIIFGIMFGINFRHAGSFCTNEIDKIGRFTHLYINFAWSFTLGAG